MQTNLNKNSNFFERTLEIALFYGFSGIPELAKALGYSSPEKLYRLKKENAKPSVDILQDLSNKFEDLDLNWYITGEGSLQKKTKVIYQSEVEKTNEKISEQKKNYTDNAPTVITVDSNDKDNIVLVPYKLKAGYLEGYNDPNFIKKLPTFRMPGLNNGIFDEQGNDLGMNYRLSNEEEQRSSYSYHTAEDGIMMTFTQVATCEDLNKSMTTKVEVYFDGKLMDTKERTFKGADSSPFQVSWSQIK